MPTSARKNGIIIAIAATVVIVIAIIAFIVIRTGSQGTIEINETNFPDPVVRAVISEQVDADDDMRIGIDEAEGVEALAFEGASDITGIAYFPNLMALEVSGPELTGVDVSDCASLESLELHGCPKLSTLDISSCPELAILRAQNTELTQLDLEGAPKLVDLQIDDDVQLLNIGATQLRESWIINSYNMTVPTVNQVEGYTTSAQARFGEDGRLVGIDCFMYDQPISYVYAYDELGNCISMDDSGTNGSPAQHWDIAYDDQNRITSAQSNLGELWSYEYDDRSEPIRCTHQANPKTAQTINFTYGIDGRLTGFEIVDEEGDARTFTVRYDSNDNVQYIGTDMSSLSASESYTVSRTGSGSLSNVGFTQQGLGSYTQVYSYELSGRLLDARRDISIPSADMNSTYPAIASTSFEYNDAGLPIAWSPVYVDSYDNNMQKPGQCTVGYHRILTTDELPAYVRALNTANIFNPSVNAQFWNPGYAFLNNLEAIAFAGIPSL